MNYASLCADTLLNRGIVIRDKNSLKALATMSPGFEMHQDTLKPGNTCVLSDEVVGAIGLTKFGDSCSITTKSIATDQPDKYYTLPVSKEGVLPLDPNEHQGQLSQGTAIYPTNGCVVRADDAVYMGNFTRDVGSIIDFENAQTLYRLRVQIAALIADCERLQNDINYETGQRNNKQNDLSHWQYWCSVYQNNRQWYRDQALSLQNQISQRRHQLEEEARKAAEEAARKAAEEEAARQAAAAQAAAAQAAANQASATQAAANEAIRNKKKKKKCIYSPFGKVCF